MKFPTSEKIKQYALLDLGFQKQVNNTFLLIRSLQVNKIGKDGIHFRAKVDQNLKEVDIKVWGPNEMAIVDIEDGSHGDEKEIFDSFIERLREKEIIDNI